MHTSTVGRASKLHVSFLWHMKVIGLNRALAVGLLFRRLLEAQLTPSKMECYLMPQYTRCLIHMNSPLILTYEFLFYIKCSRLTIILGQLQDHLLFK